MKINDIVLGEFEIEDEAVIAIVEHNSLERLRKVYNSTFGYLYDLKRNFTRFEHSVGVYLLLRKFGASREEQIAGLVHDVAHTAFSHLSTYYFQNRKDGKYTGKEYHDEVQEEFIQKSGLAELLESQGFDPAKITDKDRFPLLENDLPDICADRLDYTIRDGLHLQSLSRQDADSIIAGLEVIDDGTRKQFAFSDADAAWKYAFTFFQLNQQHYGSPYEAYFNHHFGGIIRRGIEIGVLTEADWYTDDVAVVAKLRASDDKEIQEKLASYNHKQVVIEDRDNPDFTYSKKIRTIDPPVINESTGKLQRLTEINPHYKFILDDYLKHHQKHELPIKVVRKDS